MNQLNNEICVRYYLKRVLFITMVCICLVSFMSTGARADTLGTAEITVFDAKKTVEIYRDGVIEADYPGIYFDMEENTLILDSVTNEACLDITGMNPGFKLMVIGENKLGDIIVCDGLSSTGMTIVGTGSLVINKGYDYGKGIIVFAPNSSRKLKIGKQVSVEIYGGILLENEQEISTKQIVKGVGKKNLKKFKRCGYSAQEGEYIGCTDDIIIKR